MKTLFTIVVLVFAEIVSAQEIQWQPMHRMHGAFVNSLTASPNGFLYASCGTYSGNPGGFFRSTDHGNSWHFISSEMPEAYSLMSINDSILLATNNGLYRSIDSGKTWKLVLTADAAHLGYATLVGMGAGKVVVKANADWLSTDSGETWKQFQQIGVSLVAIREGLLAVDNKGLYLSKDFKTWDTILKPSPSSYLGEVQQLPDGTIAVFSDSLYLSSDLGLSWISKPVNRKTEFGNVAPLCFLSNGALIGYVSGVDPYRSNDSGLTWSRISDVSSYQNLGGGRLYCIDSFNNAYFGKDEGYDVLRVCDTSTWDIQCLPANFAVYQLAAMGNGDLVMSPGPRYASITKDNGNSWNDLLPLQASTFWFGYQPRAGLVAESYYGYARDTGFLHSPDAISWGEISTLPFAPGSTLAGFDAKGDVFISDGSVTTDLGRTWIEHQPPPGQQVIGLPDGSCVSAAQGGLYRSTDLGLSWQETPSAVLNGSDSCIACDSSGDIVVCTGNGAFLSRDIGKNWTAIPGLPTDSVAHQVCYSTEGFWLAATGRGIFMLKNGGSAWEPENNGLDDLDILCVDVAGPGKYYVGTSLAGIYTMEAAKLAVTYGSNRGDLSIKAYPNPSTSSVSLSFTSTHAGFVKAVLFDASGNEVRSLISTFLPAGSHSLTFDHPSLPAGNYFLRIIDGGEAVVPLFFTHP